MNALRGDSTKAMRRRFLRRSSSPPDSKNRPQGVERMTVKNEEIRQRLHFIERTIFHAIRACRSDTSIPKELKDYVRQLGWQSTQAQRALLSRDENSIRKSVDDLTHISQRAQSTIRPADSMNYDVKSAVILAHLELSALRHQLG
jgi:hypothetical protein